MKITLTEMLRQYGSDFGFLKEEVGAMKPVDQKSIEQDVSNRLDRSSKLDKVDVVTFGLETDDGKIVKVYVKTDESDDFEKALADKLGEVDDIEQVLNELSKDFEIVDVEWPDKEDGTVKSSDDEAEDEAEEASNSVEAEQTGASALDPKVFNKQALSGVKTNEDLSFGEKAILEANDEADSSSSIEHRFSTTWQLLVYHAIIELGIPPIALARSPYRAQIVQGIKNRARHVSSHQQHKIALKMLINDDVNHLKHVVDDKHAGAKDHAREHEKDRKAHLKDAHLKDSTHKAKDDHKVHDKGHLVKEALEEWEFSNEDGVLTIANGAVFKLKLEPEEAEKLIKGISNREAAVVYDSEDPKVKFVFSPRGPQGILKRVGSPESYNLTSKQIEDLLSAASENKPKEDKTDKGDKPTDKSTDDAAAADDKKPETATAKESIELLARKLKS